MIESPLPELSLARHLWLQHQVWQRSAELLAEAECVKLSGIELELGGVPKALKNRILEECYELQVRSLAARFLGPGDTVLELGSAIGFVALYCQLQLGIRNYVCVEANPFALRLAERNFAINGLPSRSIHAAVASENGVVSLNSHEVRGIDPGVAIATASMKADVPSRTLHSLAASLDFKPSAMIVGIGGAEQFVNWKEIPASARLVLMEFNPQRTGYPAMYRVIAELMEQGFAVTTEEDGIYAFTRS